MKKQVITFRRPAVRRYAAGLGGVKTGAAVDFGKLVESGAGVTAVMRQEIRRAYPRSLGGGIIDMGPAPMPADGSNALTAADNRDLVALAAALQEKTIDSEHYSNLLSGTKKYIWISCPTSQWNVLTRILKKAGVNVEPLHPMTSRSDNGKYYVIRTGTDPERRRIEAALQAVCRLAAFVAAGPESSTIDPAFSLGSHAYTATGYSLNKGEYSFVLSYHIPFDREAYNRHLATQRQQEEHETYVAEQNRLEAEADAETSAKRLEESVSKNETLKVQTSTGIRRTLLWAGAAAVAVALLAAAVVVVKKRKK